MPCLLDTGSIHNPFDFQLLGQLGFLRWFRVVLDAADETFEVIPNTS